MMAGVAAPASVSAPRQPPAASSPPTEAGAIPLFQIEVAAAESATVPAPERGTEAVAEATDDNPLAGLLTMLGLLAPAPSQASPETVGDPLSAATPAATALTGLQPELTPSASSPATTEAPAASFADPLSVAMAAPQPLATTATTPVAPTPQPAAASPPPLSLQHPDFSGEVGERVRLAFDAGLSEAQIELHPSELGPIHIRIENRGDQTHVRFEAAHPATRELLAATLPQLRELLGSQGQELGRAQVAALVERRSQDSRVTPEQGRGEPPPRRRQWRVGLVDHYA
jgi:flagellar hook-length control protein FliK